MKKGKKMTGRLRDAEVTQSVTFDLRGETGEIAKLEKKINN